MDLHSSTSESHENVYNHLGNIVDLGNICSLKDATLIKKPLVTGKVIQKLPMVRKSKYQIQDVLVIHLKEVCSLNKNELLQFRAIFVDDSARLVENLCIEEGDYLAFCNVKLFPVTLYRHNGSFFSKHIVVGLESSNKIKNVFYRRKNMMRWCQFQSINSEFMESRVNDFENATNEAVPTEHLDSSSPDINEIPSTSRDFQIAIPRVERNGIIPSTSTSSDTSVEHSKMIEKANDPGSSKTSKSKNVMRDLAKVFQEQSTSKLNGAEELPRSRNEMFSSSGVYQYVKLAKLEKNCKVNVYGIVRRIVKKPTSSSPPNKCHLIVNIIDDTKTDEFLVTIFGNSLDAFPKITPYCIIRLHRLHVEEYKGGINGRVSHGRDVLVFDKDDTNITYSTAHKFTLTDSDKEKVEELREWALENITQFRPFTTLNSLELKRRKINLSGKVSHVKVFEDHPVVALRIQDGTKCTVPYHRYPLDQFDAWGRVITNAKPYHSESEYIDIVIAEPDGNFKTLKIGDQIELFNVDVTLGSAFMKTNVTEFLQFHLKGNWENLKLVSSKETHTKESSIETASLKQSGILSKSKYTLDIVRKRRLFDPDTTVVFENDDFDKNQHKSTNTDNLENNCEIFKRKAVIDLEKDSPVCNKTLRNKNRVDDVAISENQDKSTNTDNLEDDCEIFKRKAVIDLEKDTPVCSKTLDNENRVGDVAITKQHDVVKNVISRIENGPALRNGSVETENYLLKWPQPISEVPFNIKVNLISTSPAIDENCVEQDIFSLIKSYCATCKRFFSYHQGKWLEVEGEYAAFCNKCKIEGYFRELSFVLTLKVYLLDQHGEVTSAVILGENAEKFLGSTVVDICSSAEARVNVLDVLNSYFCQAGREKKFFIASIVPIPEDNEFKYHISELKLYTSLSF